MKIYTIIISALTLVGAIFWSLKSNFDYEPLILLTTSFVGIVYGIFFMKNEEIIPVNETKNNISIDKNSNNSGNINKININIGNLEKPVEPLKTSKSIKLEGDDLIEHLKRKLKILFIDDDRNFQIVKILKSSGWSKTTSIIDVKNLNMTSVKESDILFIDIRGVGKSMNLEGEGLDLALIIKQKYPEKSVVIYSANSNSNSFHDAWKIINGRLMKNALPIEFENLIIEHGKKTLN